MIDATLTEAAQNEGVDVAPSLAERLMGKLARYPGPAFRRAYLASLLESGSRLAAAGDSRSAAYCFDKVADGLKNVAEPGMSPETVESRPAVAAAKSPLELLRHQWRKDRLLDAEAVLRRQGGRLSPLENQIYRDKLDKLRASPTAKVDANLLELRRQLYRRVLKSQKVSLRRKAMPASALRHAFLLPGAAPTGSATAGASPNTNPAASMDMPDSPAQARPSGFQTIIGPYNDRYNLGDMLTLMAQADATWVEEFLDLYKGLSDLKGLVTALPNQARK